MIYLAYGSNLHPLRLCARTPSARLLGTAVLDGMDIRFHKLGRDGSGKANLVPAAGSRIHAAIFTLDPADLPALDAAEGCGRGYERMHLDLPRYGTVFTYQAAAQWCDEDLLPFSWYRDLVLAGCQRHGFPADYVARIRHQAVTEDADRERHAQHMWIVERALAES